MKIIKVLLTVLIIAAMLYIIVASFYLYGLPALLPVIMVIALFGTCLLFLWEPKND